MEAWESAVSQTHLFTLERNSSRLTLWRSSLTQLSHAPVAIRTWDDSGYFEFIVIADGEWLFYIDADTEQLSAMDISKGDQTPTLLFSNLRSVCRIRLIPDTSEQLISGELSNPCKRTHVHTSVSQSPLPSPFAPVLMVTAG